MVESFVYHLYKPKYMSFHIHFQLQAVIFDVTLTLTSDGIPNSLAM